MIHYFQLSPWALLWKLLPWFPKVHTLHVLRYYMVLDIGNFGKSFKYDKVDVEFIEEWVTCTDRSLHITFPNGTCGDTDTDGHVVPAPNCAQEHLHGRDILPLEHPEWRYGTMSA